MQHQQSDHHSGDPSPTSGEDQDVEYHSGEVGGSVCSNTMCDLLRCGVTIPPAP